MTSQDNDKPTPRTRQRAILLGIVAIFLLPVLAAVFLNSRLSDYEPEATRAYGILIEPVVSLPPELREALPEPGNWTLLIPPEACSVDCVALLDLLGRFDRALGRHADEVTELVLYVGEAPPGTGAAVPAPMSPAWSQFLRQDQRARAGALLIDPLGNAMMKYPAGFDPSLVKKDLDRLLKYSKFNES